MSIVSSIYKAPIIETITGPRPGFTIVKIRYNGKIYTGTATCSEEDMDFESKKVGSRIAESRARSLVMKRVLKEEIIAWKVKYRFFKQYERFMDYESWPLMHDNLIRQEKQIKQLQRAIHEENKSLTLYLKSQEDFINRVKKLRAKDRCK